MPVGETDFGDIRVGFDRDLTLEFHGSRVTSDAGLLPFRDLHDFLGLTETAANALSDIRAGKNGHHSTELKMRLFFLKEEWIGRSSGKCPLIDSKTVLKQTLPPLKASDIFTLVMVVETEFRPVLVVS